MRKNKISWTIWILFSICIIIYSMLYIMDLENQKKKVKDVCENFVNVCNNYTMLDNKYRKIPTGIPSNTYELYKQKLYSELSDMMVHDLEYVDYQYNLMIQNLDYQVIDNYCVITDMNKKIVEYTDFNFGVDSVQVRIKSNVQAKYLKKDDKGNIYETSTNGYEVEILKLKKQDDDWKVMAATLYYIDDLKKGFILNR